MTYVDGCEENTVGLLKNTAEVLQQNRACVKPFG